MIYQKFRPQMPSWASVPNNEDFPRFSLEEILDGLNANIQTELALKHNQNFDRQITDMAWFMIEVEEGLRRDCPEDWSLLAPEPKRYHIKRADEIGQVVTLLRYTGSNCVIKNKNDYLDLPKNKVIGFLLSKPTGSIDDSFFKECIERKARSESPEQIYKEMIKEWSPRFTFEHYDGGRDNSSATNAGFLLLVNVDPALRGIGLSEKLLKSTLQYYFETGFKYAFGFGRLASITAHYDDKFSAEDGLQSYIQLQREDGFHPSHTVRFHQKAGAKIICGLPFSSLDPESHNHSFLFLYDLREISGKIG